jgi:MFS family permease
VLLVATVLGALAATVLVPAGISLPAWAICAVAAPPLAIGAWRTPAVRRSRLSVRRRVRPPLEEVRRRPLLTAVILGLAAGVQANPTYFWVPISGFLVDDLGVSLGIASGVSAVGFAGQAVGIAAIAVIARRWDQRRVALNIAVAGSAAMALQALYPHIAVIFVATFAAALFAVGIHVVVPPLLARAPRSRRALTYGVYVGAWVLAISVLMIVEPLVTDWFGWEVVAIGQAVLGLATAPLMLLPGRDRRSRETKNFVQIWRSTVQGRCGGRRVLLGIAIMAISGAAFGLYNATYSPLLEAVGLKEWAWVPALAFCVSVLVGPLWGWVADGHRRGALIAAGAVTVLAYVVGGAQVALPVLAVITLQGFLVEAGTTGTTAVAPPVIVRDDRGEEENALLQVAKFGAMALAGVPGGLLVDARLAGLWIGALGTTLTVVGVVAAWRIPLDGRSEPAANR